MELVYIIFAESFHLYETSFSNVNYPVKFRDKTIYIDVSRYVRRYFFHQ